MYDKHGPWYIYVVRADSFCKVGISRSPAGRVACLQAACPIRLEVLHCAIPLLNWDQSPKLREAQIHAALEEQGLRLHGEWFRFNTETARIVERFIGRFSVSDAMLAEISARLTPYQNNQRRDKRRVAND